MISLSPADRQRLVKLLGLLGSDHVGERDAACLAAHRLIRDRGQTWEDVINPSGARLTPNHNTVETWHGTVAACLARSGSLRSWEQDFLSSLSRFERISPKQKSVLDQIAGRVLQRAAA